MFQRLIPIGMALGVLMATSSLAAQDSYGLPPVTTQASDGGGGGGGLRLAMQARGIATLNTLANNGFIRVTPLVTPGIRIMDGKLFIGLGLGLDEVSDATTVFHVSPTFTYDLVQNGDGALFLAGWLNLGTVGSFYFGGNIAGGIRGNINDSISIGSEWGFTFGKVDVPANDLQIGFFGTLVFEASVGV